MSVGMHSGSENAVALRATTTVSLASAFAQASVHASDVQIDNPFHGTGSLHYPARNHG